MNPQFNQPKGSTTFYSNRQAVARKFGVKSTQVVYAVSGVSLTGAKVIFDPITERSYALPTNLTSTFVDLTDGVLTHSSGTVDLGALAVLREEFFTLTENFTTGFVIRVRNEVVTDGTYLYLWRGSLPKTVNAASTPSSTGGISSSAWVVIANTNSLGGAIGASLVNTAAGVTVEQAILNARRSIYFNAADYKTPDNTWTAAITAAIAAAKLSGVSSNTVFIPASADKYFVSGITVDCPVNIIGAGKLNTTLAPVNDGDTCFLVTSQFARLADFTIQSTVVDSLSTGIDIRAALVTVENCSFAFLQYCINSPSGFGAAELDIRHNRFAASKYGIVFGGGQINSRLLTNTYSDCKCGLFITENSANVSTSIEGIKLIGDTFYSCGDNTLGLAAIEIDKCRWIWLDNVMSDLAKGPALRCNNTSYLQLTAGYYSSNHSTNRSCVIVQGNSPEFTSVGTKFSDSRNWGLELKKTADGSPARVKLTNCIFQFNDIDSAQNGDFSADSVSGIEAVGCTFLANKPTGISLFNNQTGGSTMTTRFCHFYGQVFLGDANCKFYHYDSPTHPDKQNGILTITDTTSAVTTPVSIKSLVVGRGICVVANAASSVAALAAGVSGSNIQITRTGTAGAMTVQFTAELIQV